MNFDENMMNLIEKLNDLEHAGTLLVCYSATNKLLKSEKLFQLIAFIAVTKTIAVKSNVVQQETANRVITQAPKI